METAILIDNGIQGEQNLSYYISEDAVFPSLKPTCNIENLQQGDRILRVWSEQSLLYNGNGRNDLWSGVAELAKQAQEQVIPIAVPDVRGGAFSLKCFATIKDRFNVTRTIASQVVPYVILAQQPVKKNIRTPLKSDYLQAVVYKRSAFEQFTRQGEPVFQNGVGLYRVASPTVAEIWNWKSNAATALADFENRKTIASQIPAKYRTDNPDLYENLPDFTAPQIELEALQSYGTGPYYVPKRSGLSRKWKWVIGAPNDGFADSCLALLKEVAAGKLPVGWD